MKLPAAAAKIINAGSADTGISYADGALNVGGWGWLKLGQLDGNAYFVIMVVGGLATIIYAKLMIRDITIKMPDSVPPAVAKAFTAIIPAAVALYATAIMYYIFSLTLGKNGDVLISWVQKTIADPFLHIGQSLGAIILVTFLVSLMWLFGLHGSNVMAPVLEGIWGVGLLKNTNVYDRSGMAGVKEAIKAGNGDAYMWVRGSFDSYAWFGGVGGTITLLIVILVFSKRADYRMVAKLGIAPSVFNINEPLQYGAVVGNPYMLIPTILIAIILPANAYIWMKFGFASINYVNFDMNFAPNAVSAFFMSGGDVRNILLVCMNLLLAALIWYPFFKAADKAEYEKEEKRAAEKAAARAAA